MTSQLAVQPRKTDIPKTASHVLTLVATMILADVRAHGYKSQTFISEARCMEFLHKLGLQISEARLLLWFELHKDLISEKMRTRDFKTWFYDILDSLNNLSEKMHILNMMQRLSNTDQQVNINGQALFELTKRYWKF